MRPLAVLYAFADGRATAGGPVDPDLTDVSSIVDLNALRLFLLGRLYGRLKAERAIAAEACRLGPEAFDGLTREADLHAGSFAAQESSRARGHTLLLLGRRTWPDMTEGWPQQLPEPVALGALSALGGAGPEEADALALYAGISTAAWTIARRRRFHPADVGALIVDLCAAAPSPAPIGTIPDTYGPVTDAVADFSARRQVGLYAS